MPSPNPDDEGFITPVFAGLGLAMILVGAAFLMAARQDLAAARTASARQAEQLRLEGRVMAGALRVLAAPGQDGRGWAEGRGARLLAEPEGRKINPQFADQPRNQAVIERLVGPARAETVAKALADEVAALPRLARRRDLERVSSDPRWRACATSAFSAYSQQTALTLEPVDGAPGHVGEIWRIAAVGPDGAWVDRIIRFSADDANPIDTLEQDTGRTGGAARVDCQRLIQSAEG